jgi:hypothetical protein
MGLVRVKLAVTFDAADTLMGVPTGYVQLEYDVKSKLELEMTPAQMCALIEVMCNDGPDSAYELEELCIVYRAMKHKDPEVPVVVELTEGAADLCKQLSLDLFH